jgi:hypothetical protein
MFDTSDYRDAGAGPDYTWLDAVEQVLDASIEEEADLEATLEEVEVDIPTRYGDDAPFGRWRFDGSVTVSVDGMRGGLAEWIRYYRERDRGRS